MILSRFHFLRFILALFLFQLPIASFAQVLNSSPGSFQPGGLTEKCASHLIHDHRMATDPVYAMNHENLEDFIRNFQPKKANGQYRIPVVVHVVYYSTGIGAQMQNITDVQIRQAIQRMNEQFRRTAGTPWFGGSVDTDIEFSLAVRDPAGNCTNGITRDNAQVVMTAGVFAEYQNNGVEAATANGITDAQIKAVNQWPSNSYYNIWLVPEFDGNNGGNGVQGYATFATSAGTTADGGVMLGIDFISSGSWVSTHELGHSLNLYHTFHGDGGGGTCPSDAVCGTSGDCVADTPRHMRSVSDCDFTGTTCAGASKALHVYNYMDYSNCANQFTPNQTTRMVAAINGARASLLQANGCMSLVPPAGPGSPTVIRADKTVLCAGESIRFFDDTPCVPNDFLDQVNQWSNFTFQWTVTNGTETLTSNHQNPTFTPAGAGAYDVTLTITHPSFGTITGTFTDYFSVAAGAVTACTPNMSSNNTGNYGQTVSNVTFNTINNTTSYPLNGGYQNFVCTYNTQVLAGSTYLLSVTANRGGSGSQAVEVDIDWNNDGDFGDAGENAILTGSATTVGTPAVLTANITIPLTAVTNVLLRMRVQSDCAASITAAQQNCTASYFIGDVEDYGVYIYTPVCTPSATSQPANAAVCSGTSVNFTAAFSDSPVSYVWQVSTDGGTTWTNLTNGAPYSGVTTASLTVNPAASGLNSYRYRCVATNGCGSGNSNAAILTVTGTPATPTITAGGPLTFCSGGSVVLTSSSATGNTWSDGATTQSITVTTSGTYTVTAANGSCASPASAGTVVTVNPTPVISLGTVTNPTTCASSTGSITINGSGTGDLSWTGPVSGSQSSVSLPYTITNLPQGSYTITFTSGGCVSNQLTQSLTDPSVTAPVISASGPLTFCSGDNVVLTSSEPAGNTWSTGETTQSVTVTTSGNYTVSTVTGACTATSAAAVVTVNATPATPVISASGPLTFCSGDNVVLTSSAAGGNTWSDGQTTQSITVTASGTYTVTASGSGCVSPVSSSVTVSVSSSPSTPTISASGALTFCSGGSVMLTSSAGSGNTWSTGETTQSITVTASGNYSVTVGSTGCSATSAVTVVTVNASPATPVISVSGPTDLCPGQSVVLTSSEPAGNTWSEGSTGNSIIVTTGGNYTVSVTNSGCTSTSAAITVTVNSSPVITPGALTDPSSCSSATGSIEVNGTGTGALSWTGSGSGTLSVSLPATITNLVAGSYTIEFTASSGCVSNQLTETLNDPAAATPVISAGGPTTFCAGGSVVLTSSAASGNTWSTGQTTQSITVSATGTYSVTVVTGSCSATSADEVVTVNPLPVISIGTVTDPTACNNTDGSVEINGTGPGSLSWTGTTGGTQAVVLPYTVTSLGAGTYGFTFTDNNSCASAVVTQTLNDPGAPTVTITAGGPVTFCNGDNVVLSASSATGITWSTGETTQSITVSASGTYSATITDGVCTGNSNTISVVVNPVPSLAQGVTNNTSACGLADGSVEINGSSSGTLSFAGPVSGTVNNVHLPYVVSGLSAGNYIISFTSAEGCAAQNITVTITEPAPQPVSITNNGPTTFCEGGSVLLNSSSATGNIWSTGETSQSIIVSQSGSYGLTVDLNGCQSDGGTVSVTVNPLPVITIVSETDPSDCVSENGLISVNGSGTGTLGWTGAENGNQNVVSWPAAIANLGEGNYTIVFVSAAGCISQEAHATLNNPGGVPVTIFADGPLEFCDGGSVKLTSSVPTGNSWSTGETTATILVNSSSVIGLTNSSNGCEPVVSEPIEIHVFEKPVVKFNYNTVICNDARPFELSGGYPFGGTYTGIGITDNTLYPQNISGETIEVTYTYTNEFGCTESADDILLISDCSPLNPDSLIFYVPNAFSPDGDEYNNEFKPVMTQGFDVSSYTLRLYNRWGEIVFESHNIEMGWDGTYHGTKAPSGTYTFEISYKLLVNDARQRELGSVTLLR